tara:strand:- start:634 stop:837 length:204 start_codon:yes stop_codon:yes gene_type:complete
MFNYINELGKHSLFIGFTTSSLIFLNYTLLYRFDNNNTDWKDVALVGCLGAILSSKVSITNSKLLGY